MEKSRKRADICYELEPADLYEENLKQAEEDFKRLVAEGYASVQIVVSRHPYSLGLWVEANEKPNRHSNLDHVIKSYPCQ